MRTTNRGSALALAGLALTLSLPACGDDPVEEAEHPSVVVTQWNDSTELFLEYPELVAGQATGNWAIHLSNMKNFKAVTAGTLTVRFLQNGAEVKSFTLPAPARAGIYLLDPVIDRAGTYQVHLALRGPEVSSQHMLRAVRVHGSAEKLPEAPPEEAGGISFLKEQQWQMDFAVRPAEEQLVQRTVTAPGEIVPPDGALAEVSAPVSGIAQPASNLGAPSVGQAVAAGQVLAVLAPSAEAGGYARLRGEMERLEREAARAERLYAAGAIPEKRLEEARHDLEIARAEIAAMGGGGDADFRLRVRAPISGVIASREFVPGGRVEAGDSLFTIVNPSVVWLRVNVPAAAASAITRAARPTFVVEGAPRPFSAGSLVSVGSVLDPETRTVPAVFAVANPGGVLKVGQYVQASVPAGGTAMGVAIPNEAILDDNGSPVAYVQVSGETFERRALALGVSDGRLTQVVNGIRAGEMVVTTGAYQVRLASMSGSSFGGGHAH